MGSIFRSHHPLRHTKSFKYAFEGLFFTFANEPNFRVQTILTILVLILGLVLKIGFYDWLFLIISLGILLSAELINTALENLMDLIYVEYHEGVKKIKDISAAFVLVSALCALAVILFVFGKIFIKFII